MLQEAALIGGAGRLDSRLMQGHGRTVPNRLVLAKEGADGLLGIGLIPQLPFKNGLGMLIKLAGGYDPAYLETVYDGLLTALGLAEGEKPGLVERQATGQETQFHFEPLIGTAILDDALVL
jgi:L-asparaginase II